MVDMEGPKRKMRLGEILVRNGWVTWENLEKALAIQKELDNSEKIPAGSEVLLQAYPQQMLSIGEILVRNGWMTWEQLDIGLEIQKRTGHLLGKILVDRQFITNKECYRAIAIQMNMVFIDFDKIRVDSEAIRLVPGDFARGHQLMPIVRKQLSILIAVSNPSNVDAERELQLILPGYKIHTGIATPEDLKRAIAQYYPG